MYSAHRFPLQQQKSLIIRVAIETRVINVVGIGRIRCGVSCFLYLLVLKWTNSKTKTSSSKLVLEQLVKHAAPDSPNASSSILSSSVSASFSLLSRSSSLSLSLALSLRTLSLLHCLSYINKGASSMWSQRKRLTLRDPCRTCSRTSERAHTACRNRRPQ